MPKTYYVSISNGNDSNNGSEGKPVKTIQAGIDKASSGDTVLIREGIYPENVLIEKKGTSSRPIRIAAYEDEQVALDGSTLRLGEGGQLIRIIDSTYLTVEGLEIRYSGGRGIAIEDSSELNIQNCNIHNCQKNGIHAQDTEQITIDGCHVHMCATHLLATGKVSTTKALFFRRSDDVVITNNVCYENMNAGVAILFVRNASITGNTCYDNRGAQIEISSSRDIIVGSNFCYHTGREEFLDLTGQRPPAITKTDRERYQETGPRHTRSIRITNNVMSGCGSGFFVSEEGGLLTSVTLGHNTIINSTQAGIKINTPRPHSGTTFENNLIAGPTGAPLVHMANPSGVSWRNNFWSAYPTNYAANPSNDVIDANSGLRDINASLIAGQSTADNYVLTETAPAINQGRSSNVALDYWGNSRDSLPDMGAHEFSGPPPPDNGDDVELPPPGTRVTKDLQTLYDFSTGWGDTIADVSGVGDPLNLTIRDAAAIQWNPDGLNVIAPTIIRSQVPATKLIAASKSSNEITIEAWVKPASVEIDWSARILSLSSNTLNRNVTLGQGLKDGQTSDLYNVRLRTSNSSANGIPSISSPAGSLEPVMTHVTFTRDQAGRATLYINGQERAVDQLSGNLSNWDDSFELLLANEMTGDRRWLGIYRLAAAYSRALHPLEVEHNYLAGLPNEEPVVAAFRIQPGQEVGVAPHLVMFDSSESTSTTNIVSYQWDFGDGSTSAEANPDHLYETPGVYSVSLAVADVNGNTSAVSKDQLVRVTEMPLPTLPGDYARFALANVVESRVLSFGIQYPDLRCVLAWNEEPHHIVIYHDIIDILRAYEIPGTVELIWIDHPEDDSN